LFLFNAKNVSNERFPIESGIAPDNLFPHRDSSFKLVAIPISPGIFPEQNQDHSGTQIWKKHHIGLHLSIYFAVSPKPQGLCIDETDWKCDLAMESEWING
jgi:hypothetical protein